MFRFFESKKPEPAPIAPEAEEKGPQAMRIFNNPLIKRVGIMFAMLSGLAAAGKAEAVDEPPIWPPAITEQYTPGTAESAPTENVVPPVEATLNPIPGENEAEPPYAIPAVESAPTSERDWKLRWPGADLTFLHRDANGKIQWDLSWQNILFPAQLELKDKTDSEQAVTFNLPHEYARNFDHYDPQRADDYDKLATFTEAEIRKLVAEKLYGLDFSKQAWQAEHGAEQPLQGQKVNGIRITGLASPEGPAYRGPSTLAPGEVDEENIFLAQGRAGEALALVENALKDLGVPQDALAAAAKELKAEEVQFTQADLIQLTELAAQENLSADELGIFQLVQHYNNGAITNPTVFDSVRNIMAAKRGAEVTITLDGGEQRTLLIPLPLLLLLPFFRLPKRKPKPTRPPEPKPTSGPEPIPEQPPYRVIDVPPAVKETPLPPAGPEREDIEERTYLDDIGTFLYQPEAIERGLDYATMADQMVLDYNLYANDSDRELYLTQQILAAWKKHDLAARRLSGWEAKEGKPLDWGLDYEQQPKQIQWAKMHAKELLTLASEKHALAPQSRPASYWELPGANARTAELWHRRNNRRYQ